jgi:hypothetical protein
MSYSGQRVEHGEQLSAELPAPPEPDPAPAVPIVAVQINERVTRPTIEHPVAPQEPTSRPAEEPLPPLPAPWLERRPRSLPPAVKWAGGGLAVAFVLVLISAQSRPASLSAAASQPIPTELFVSESELEKREPITADAFRPRPAPEPPAAEPDEQSELAALMEARRRRRADNPEEVLDRKMARAATSEAKAPEQGGESSVYQPRPQLVVFPDGSDGESAPAGGRLRAGTTLRGVLRSSIVLEGGQSTAVLSIKRAQAGVPAGSMLVGSAHADRDGTVSIRFATLVLADGRELRIEAEAQSLDGEFGVAGVVDTSGDTGNRTEETVTGSRTARRLIGGLAGGYVSSAVDDVVDSRRRDRPTRRTRIQVTRGTELNAFFHRGVSLASDEEAP